MPLLPPNEQTTARAVGFSGGSLLKHEDALAWKMLWAEGESDGGESVQYHCLLAGA
jgi:hypothetical protein